MAVSLTSTGLSGEVSNSLQPAFCVKFSGNQNTPASGATLVWGTERFDQSGDFTSNTFTAPVAGKYQLQFATRFNTVDLDNTYIYMQIVTSNHTYEMNLKSSYQWDADAPYMPAFGFALCDMDASDTAFIRYNFATGVTVASIDIGSYFSGFLAC
jgi:hypothetical protein